MTSKSEVVRSSVAVLFFLFFLKVRVVLLTHLEKIVSILSLDQSGGGA